MLLDATPDPRRPVGGSASVVSPSPSSSSRPRTAGSVSSSPSSATSDDLSSSSSVDSVILPSPPKSPAIGAGGAATAPATSGVPTEGKGAAAAAVLPKSGSASSVTYSQYSQGSIQSVPKSWGAMDNGEQLVVSVYVLVKSLLGASGASQGAIDNRIEQAMDLVKNHLMSAVRGEVEDLKEKIVRLEEHMARIQIENHVLREHVPSELQNNASQKIAMLLGQMSPQLQQPQQQMQQPQQFPQQNSQVAAPIASSSQSMPQQQMVMGPQGAVNFNQMAYWMTQQLLLMQQQQQLNQMPQMAAPAPPQQPTPQQAATPVPSEQQSQQQQAPPQGGVPSQPPSASSGQEQ